MLKRVKFLKDDSSEMFLWDMERARTSKEKKSISQRFCWNDFREDEKRINYFLTFSTMRPSFTKWVLSQLSTRPMTDEELCGEYVRKYYSSIFEFVSYRDIAVWWKKYSTCERILRRMRLKWKIQEVSRKHRKNNSDEILFQLYKLYY